MRKINKFIFIALLISSSIFIGRELLLNPSDAEYELEAMTVFEHEENLLPSIKDVIIKLEGLNLLKKKKMGETLTFREKNFSLPLEEKKLNKKLDKLMPVWPDLIFFRDHLNRLLALAKRFGPTMKNSQNLQDFLENLTTIFNMSHDFLEKERNIIERKTGTTEIFNTIIYLMNGIYNNFNKQLQDMMLQARQGLKNVTR